MAYNSEQIKDHRWRGLNVQQLAVSIGRHVRLKLTFNRVQRKVYRNLRRDEFRLLSLHHVSESQLRCSLREQQLSSFPTDPGYVAVSYTWAEPSTNHKQMECVVSNRISINHHHPPAAQKLEPMLRILNELNCSNLWIDAVCIDQDDPGERGYQVARMREIYSRANKVVVILAPSSPRTTLFFQFMASIDSSGTRMSSDAFAGLIEILNNRYWKRAWIIQEIAVARRVQLVCGLDSCKWDDFASLFHRWDVVAMLEELTGGTFTLDREIRAIDRFRQGRRQPLLSVLTLTRSTRATDPRDTIYAKLGLASDAVELVPRPTYRIDTAVLFKLLVKTFIEQKHNLYILCLIREKSTPVLQLPSWTPDWSQSTERRNLIRFFFHGWMEVSHIPHSKMDVTFSHNLDELRVRGTIFDTVGSCAQPNEEAGWAQQRAPVVFPAICRTAVADHFVLLSSHDISEGPTAFVEQFALLAGLIDAEIASAKPDRDFRKSDVLSKSVTLNPENLDEIDDFGELWTGHEMDLLISDKFRHWYQRYRSVRIGSRTISSWAHLYLRSRSESHNLPEVQMRRTGGIERSLAIIGWSRTLVGTVCGRPALVPDTTVDSDLICVLYGCPVPVILRKVSNSYRFIGECYVDDVMDNVLYEHKDLHWKDVTFHLR